MGVKLNFEAVNALPNPLQAGTIYYVDHGDGTATQVVTDATGQVSGRQIVGLMAAGTLGRGGAVNTRLSKSGTTLAHKFTNTSGAPIVLSGVTIEAITFSAGTATLYVFNESGQVLASTLATAQDGGLTAPLVYIIPAGATVLIGVISTGGYLTASLSSGHTWPGLAMADAGLYTTISVVQGGMVNENNGVPTAQLRFQFGVGGQVVRRLEAGDGLTDQVQNGTLTMNLAPIDLGASDVSGTDALPSGQNNLGGSTVQPGEEMILTVLRDATLRELRMRWMGSGTLTVLHNTTPLHTVTMPAEAIQTLIVPLPDLQVVTGDTLRVRVDATPTYLTPVGGAIPGPDTLETLGGLLRWENPTAAGWIFEVDLEGGLLAGKLPMGRIDGLTSALDSLGARMTAVEARPVLDAEFVQDTVGQMIPGATYNDATGELTLPEGSSADPETIRDLVAAFLAAGTNVTITHNDAGDTLTISAAGGGSGSGTATANLSGAAIAVLTYQPTPVQDAGPSAGIYGQGVQINAEITISGFTISVGAGARTDQYGAIARLDGSGNIVEVTRSTNLLTSTAAGDFTFNLAGATTLPVGNYIFGLDAAGNSGTARQTQINTSTGTYSEGNIALNGWRRTDSSAVGSGATFTIGAMAHRLKLFNSTRVKTVVGPLEPVDFPVVTAVAEIPNSAGARLAGQGKIYIRISTGQLFEFVGTPVSG